MATVETKERPILFSDAMVRAILAGTKTVTRLVIKPQPPEGATVIGPELYHPAFEGHDGFIHAGPEVFGVYSDDGEWGARCPYGAPGDRLWVRECWQPLEFSDTDVGVVYRATPVSDTRGRNNTHWFTVGEEESLKWCHRSPRGYLPSIHMPRWASRLLLEVKSIRAERVQEISEEDAIAEGLKWSEGDGFSWGFRVSDGCVEADPIQAFAELWDSINGTRAGCAWAGNPWVWVVEFEQVQERA